MAIVKSEYNVLNPTSGQYDTHYLKTSMAQVVGLQDKIDDIEGDITTLSSGKVDVSTYNTDMALKAPLTSPAFLTSATLDGKNLESVEESGTNYIRYASGLQICWGIVGTTPATVTYPKAFASIIIVVVSGETNSSNGVPASAWQNRTSTTIEIRSEYGWGTSYIAIGRWK